MSDRDNDETHHDNGFASSEAGKALSEKTFRPEGPAIHHADNLPAPGPESQQAVILMAAWPGNTRLIDNQTVLLTPIHGI